MKIEITKEEILGFLATDPDIREKIERLPAQKIRLYLDNMGMSISVTEHCPLILEIGESEKDNINLPWGQDRSAL